MTDVFLSYSREDEKSAARIAGLLESAGLSVWWDSQIPPGKTWDQVIGKALDEAKCVVVLWTRTSVDSDWVKEEASRGARRKALVPVILDEVEAPLGFGRIEAAELSRWEGDITDREFRGFVAAVQELVEKPLHLEPAAPGRQASTPPRRMFVWAGVALALFALGSMVVWRMQSGPPPGRPMLDAKIWQVEVDRKGAVAAATTFSMDGGQDSQDDLAARVVEWIGAEVVPAGAVAPIHIELSIPQDLARDRIRIRSRPEIDLKTYLYISSVRGKSRVPSQLRPEDLAFAGESFAIEIAATGYDSIPVPVVAGEAQERTFEMKPLRLKLAVEEIGGRQNRFAARLTELLSSHQRIQVFGPEALLELQREIERSRDAIGVNRAAQTAIRDSLGVDYIVGGELSDGTE